MAAARIKVGDCYEIRLPDGRYAYCQYLRWNEQLGCLVRVLDLVTEVPLSSVHQLQCAGDIFPPVFVGLRASVRSGRWKFVGTLPVNEFKFPVFRATSATKPGTYNNWYLWDGQEQRFIGQLPPELRSLEIELVWGDEILEERIAYGRNPFAEIQ
jgi:hypothetical protein